MIRCGYREGGSGVFARVLHKVGPSLGQCRSLDVNSGVSVDALIEQKLAWSRTGTECKLRGILWS